MRLFCFHDLSCRFCGLIQVDSSSFFIFFFYFFLQHQVVYELTFIVYFDFLSTKLSWSHNSGHRFDKLIRVDLMYHCLNSLKTYHLIYRRINIYKRYHQICIVF